MSRKGRGAAKSKSLKVTKPRPLGERAIERLVSIKTRMRENARAEADRHAGSLAAAVKAIVPTHVTLTETRVERELAELGLYDRLVETTPGATLTLDAAGAVLKGPAAGPLTSWLPPDPQADVDPGAAAGDVHFAASRRDRLVEEVLRTGTLDGLSGRPE